MKNKYKVEQMAEKRWYYTFTDPNKKGETLVIELSKCTNSGGKNDLPVIWYKHGYIDRILKTYWWISTYVTDTEGNCYGRYNPQIKLTEDGKRQVINFDWMLEAAGENKERLLNEVYWQFLSSVFNS